MARENMITMIGRVYAAPVIKREKGRAEFVLETVRRTGRYDFPLVYVYNQSKFEKIEAFKKGDFIVISGTLATLNVTKKIECPFCQTQKSVKGQLTIVNGIDPVFIGKDYSLEQFKEVSNLTYLLGTICNENGTEYSILPGSETSSCHYQIAVNRKFKVGNETDTADYPWINSFGKQADEDKEHLQYQSQLYIRGALQTRKISKPITCDICKKEFSAEDKVTEVVPYFVEYLDHCKF